MASRYNGEWQSSRRTVLERNTYMFDNPLFSDVSFTCGESRRVFHAHKYVLATSSAVFEAMFYGDLTEKGTIICISDTDEDTFEEFLRFLYTDDCKILVANAIRLSYLAKKYLISPLAEKCCKVLEANIKPDNIFAVLEQTIQFNEKELKVKCWDIISRKTSKAVTSKGFCNISSRTLNDLLKRETLEITEVELFKGVLKWVDSECERQGINIDEDSTARRRVLGDSSYDIRFLAMSQEEFGKHVLSCGILTDAEVVSLFKKFNGLDVADLKWQETAQRHSAYRSACMISVNRFGAIVDAGTSSWVYDGISSDALTLVVNKTVLFHGVRLFGDTNSSEYKVKLAIKDKNVRSAYTSELGNDNVWGYDVLLPKPISLVPKEEVTIIATIKGPSSQSGRKGRSLVKVNNIVVTFKDAPLNLSSNCTRITSGQFYKFYLSELQTVERENLT